VADSEQDRLGISILDRLAHLLIGRGIASSTQKYNATGRKEFNADRLFPCYVVVDSHSSPSVVTIILRQSKNDPFAMCTKLYLGATGLALCPVASRYLAICPCHETISLFKNGSTLSKPRLAHCLCKALIDIGVASVSTAFKSGRQLVL